ncbi:MFS transporter [Sphingomonas sp. CBMAI 2297]|uniref:MFS transporter n=1 Tax=Sphingomonas sp. CBMAI 2297 TaxID=2991720 RepID=UPI002454C9D7|nr:MFS transporter [Sphingomonas sp. CBMAI 2297]MDH4745912.1 MFS transporter [Sphingomonas sp. CBMAI 2297]
MGIAGNAQAGPATWPVFYRLAGTELWERFSLHGMKALLTLYLVREVLADGAALPWGMAGLRAMLEALWGPLSPIALGSNIYGLYAALTYFVLPLGGLAGDRLFGRRAAVVAGAVLIACGHLLLTDPYLLLPALLLLILGTGLLKGNLAAQVGELFPAPDGRRDKAFAIYLAFLNIGVMLGPLVCGLLAQALGWGYAFGAAGVAMLAGLGLYLTIPATPRRARARPALEEDRAYRPVTAIGAILVVILAFCAYEQVSNIFLLWVADAIRPTIWGLPVPPAWFASADGVFTILMVILTMRWRWLASLRDWDRLAMGCAAIMLGYGLLALVAGTGLRSTAGPLAVLLLLDLGVALVWPAGLAIITGATPQRLAGVMVGIFYLHGFFANLVVGALGALYERVPVATFWSIHAGIAASAMLVSLMLRAFDGEKRMFRMPWRLNTAP